MLEARYTSSYFCPKHCKSFEEPLDLFDFGDSKQMALTVGYVKQQCPFCDSRHKMELSVSREFIVGTDIIVTKDPKTVGHLAHRNTDRIGRAKIEDKRFAYERSRREAAKKTAEAAGGKLIERDKSYSPWWRDGTIPGVRKYDKVKDLPVIKDTKKYIEKGEL